MFIPIIFPEASTSGPPEYPGLSLASVITASSTTTPHHPGMVLLGFVTIPEVMFTLLPSEFASARTNCPDFSGWESPSSIGFNPVASTFSNATSDVGSRPIIFASRLLPSCSSTLALVRLPTTWFAVTTCPSLSHTTPLPPHLPISTFTTEGETRSARPEIASDRDCNSCVSSSIVRFTVRVWEEGYLLSTLKGNQSRLC